MRQQRLTAIDSEWPVGMQVEVHGLFAQEELRAVSNGKIGTVAPRTPQTPDDHVRVTFYASSENLKPANLRIWQAVQVPHGAVVRELHGSAENQ